MSLEQQTKRREFITLLGGAQITHATDSDTNVERDYITDELRKSGVIGEINSYKAGQRLASKYVNHYVTDGEVTAASLMVKI